MTQGRRLTLAQKEAIRAAYQETPNVEKVANRLKFSSNTVALVVKEGKQQGLSPTVARRVLRTLAEHEIRRKGWETAGALVLLKEELLQVLQAEMAKPIPDPQEAKAWAAILKDLQVAYGIDIDKARLLNEQATQITVRAEELRRLPAGFDRELLVRVLQYRATGDLHPSLRPPASHQEAPTAE